MYTIEFQKRGLPHAHILITRKNRDKLRTPEGVKKFISAEIPDPNENQWLHEIFMKNMIHGPCGDWCMVKNRCSKNFPKTLREETIINGNNKPIYKCRNDGKKYQKKPGFEIHNRYIVPYNPLLLLMFNCHIICEEVISNRSIKYIYLNIY